MVWVFLIGLYFLIGLLSARAVISQPGSDEATAGVLLAAFVMTTLLWPAFLVASFVAMVRGKD